MALSRSLSRCGVLSVESVEFLSGGDPVTKAVNIAGAQATNGPADVIDGLPMRQVVLTFAPVAGTTAEYPIARRVTLAYGKTDNLLRRVITETIEPDGSRTRRTELHRNIRVNTPLPDSLFVFTPPPGAVEAPAPPPAPRSPAAPTLAGSNGIVSPRLQSTVTGEVKPTSTAAGPALGTIPVFKTPGSVSKPASPAATPTPLSKKPSTPSAPSTAPAPQPAQPATGKAPHGPYAESPLTPLAYLEEEAAEESGLQVIADEQVKPAEGAGGSGMAVASFGNASLLDAQNVERTFRLKNTGKTPVTLDRVQTTCGCLSALVSPDAPSAVSPATQQTALAMPYTVKPGETVALRMRVDLTALHPGPLTKTLLVWTREQQDVPALRLQMQGTLVPLITFDPPQLTIGKVTAGAKQSTLITATASDALLERSRKAGVSPFPALIANVPGITATRVPDSGSATDPHKARYSVSVDADAPIGPLFLEMGFVPTDPIKSDEQRNVAIAWRLGARLLTSAEVTGDISVPSNQLAFSLVPSNLPADSAKRHQAVTVSGNPEALAGLKAEAESPYLMARVLPKKDGAAGVDVDVALKPECPAGPMQSRLVLSIPNGQKLVVYVSGYIAPPTTAAMTPMTPMTLTTLTTASGK